MSFADERPLDTGLRVPLVAGMLLFAAVFVGGGVWASTSQLSGAVIAPGTIDVVGKPKIIEHLDGGIVAEIAVDVGDTVGAGDTLLVLDDTLLRANLEIYRNRLTEAAARRARLLAERDGALSVEWSGGVLARFDLEPDPDALAGQQRLFDARAETRKGQSAQLREQFTQQRERLSGIGNVLRSKSEQTQLLLAEYDSMRTLSEKGYAPRNRVAALEREVRELTGQQSELEAERASVASAMSEIEIMIAQVDREFREAVLAELRQADAEVIDLAEQIGATKDQLDRIEVRSPVSGMINELSVNTIGGVVAPGEPVMTIVPTGGALSFEVRVEPQFADDLYLGQPAKVRFPSLNQAKTPELDATVSVVSPSSIYDEASGLSFYVVRVEASEDELARLGEQILLPGMPVEAYVQTGSRSALSYLLKPFRDQMERGMREPG